MKLQKRNIITNQVVTKNDNSKQMPTFLLGTQPRIFQFNQVNIIESKKKLFPSKNTSTIQIKDQIRNFRNTTPVQSIKNISTLNELLTDEVKHQQKTQKKIYLNHIFGHKKQYQVQPNYVEEHKYIMPKAYKQYIDTQSNFQKPNQFAKIVDQLSSTNMINRKPQIPVEFGLSTQQRNKTISKKVGSQTSIVSHATQSNRFKSVYKNEGQKEIQNVKRGTFYNTIQKNKRLYDHLLKQQKKQNEEKIMLSNAISNMVVGDHILQILQRNKRKLKK